MAVQSSPGLLSYLKYFVSFYNLLIILPKREGIFMSWIMENNELKKGGVHGETGQGMTE